jgi:MFS family permease
MGTSLSLGVFALAQSAAMIFIARMIDGVTGGNISVAQAIISDSAKGEDRAKSFGMLGAAFGFGFLFGPAIGGILGRYGMTLPFWFAAALALVAVVLSALFLPETLKPSLRNVQKKNHEPLFKFRSLFEALFKPYTGIVLAISLISVTALNAFYIGFQTYTNDVLNMTPLQIGAFFSAFGLVGILMQVFAIGPVLKRFHSKKAILQFSLVATTISMVLSFFAQSAWMFFATSMIFAVLGAFRDPIISALLSERTKAEDQGGIMGINQAYVALGSIFGPLSAGAVVGLSVNYVFLVAAGFLLLSVLATKWLKMNHKPLDL